MKSFHLSLTPAKKITSQPGQTYSARIWSDAKVEQQGEAKISISSTVMLVSACNLQSLDRKRKGTSRGLGNLSLMYHSRVRLENIKKSAQ
jgi:hypothetical protein